MRGVSHGYRHPPMAEKRKANANRHANILSNDGASDDEGGEDTSGSPDGPPPSKRPRLSEEPGAPDEQSPAANKIMWTAFLHDLSRDNSYNSLVFRVLELPAPVSPFFLHP
jgi:hypothetical protein